MKIVTTTSVFPYDYPVEQALTRLARLGYSSLDLAIDYCAQNRACPFTTDGWEDWAKSLRWLAEQNDVEYTHAHAPGNVTSRGECVFRSFELCRILGTKYMVVHPYHKRADDTIIDDDDEFVELNVKALPPLLEAAEKNGVILLAENLLWGSGIRVSAVSQLISEVNSPYLGLCYDTGHANARGHHYRELIGLKHVPMSLHVQDNFGSHDDHLLPGDGIIDWKGFWDTLRTLNYQGELVLEAHHQSLVAKDEDRDAILVDLLERAKKMRDYFIR